MYIDTSGKLLCRMIRAIAFVAIILLSIQALAQPGVSIVLSVDWNNTGTKIAAGYDTGGQHTGLVEVIDSSTGQILQSFQFPGFIAEVVWSPHDSDLLAAVANYIDMPGTIHILNTATGQEIMTLTEGEQILSITWSPDGSRIAGSVGFTANPISNRHITIWDTTTWQVSNTIIVGPGVDAFALDWSPDGSRIAGGEIYGNIMIWDASTGAIDTTFTGHTGAIYSVAWSPDGSKLASASSLDDPTIRVWDATTGQELLVIPDSGANNITWSPDGSRIAAAVLIDIVRIWDAATGQLVDTITQTDDVYTVAWSPDGSKLALGDAGGITHIVPAPGVRSPQPADTPFPGSSVLDDSNRSNSPIRR